MKKIILSSAVMALLVFSGCSSNEPVVEDSASASSQNAKEVKAVESESVSTEQSEVSSTSNSGAYGLVQAESMLKSIYFDFDKFNIKDSESAKLDRDAEVAKTDAKDYTIKLEGNCDEWGSDEYNFALGLKRANAVKKALVAQGIEESRITLVSYGESNPVCSEKTKECWSKNRRVDFKLLP